MTGRPGDHEMGEPEMTDERLHALIDGELDAGAEAALERELAADPGAAARRRQYAAQKALLSEALALAAADPGDPYTGTLADGLARRLAPRRRRWLLGFGVAAALLATGWLGHAMLGPALEPTGEPMPELVADAAQIHELFADDPELAVELTSAESGRISKWMTRAFGEPVAVPDLRALGLTFVGGRLLGNEEGPFAQLLYEAPDGARVSLSVSRQMDGAADTLQLVRIDDLNAGYWQDEDLAYAIVAEAPTARLRTIASRLGADTGHL